MKSLPHCNRSSNYTSLSKYAKRHRVIQYRTLLISFSFNVEGIRKNNQRLNCRYKEKKNCTCLISDASSVDLEPSKTTNLVA